MQGTDKRRAFGLIGMALLLAALPLDAAWSEAPKRSLRPLARPVVAAPPVAPVVVPIVTAAPPAVAPADLLPAPTVPAMTAVPLLALPGQAPLAPAIPPGLMAFVPDPAAEARPRPLGRPLVAGQPVTGAAITPPPAASLAGLSLPVGPLAGLRPKARPRGLVTGPAVPPVAPVAAVVAPVPAGLLRRPERRPAMLTRRAPPVVEAPERVAAVAAIRPAPGTGPLTGRRGSVCGIDSIRGETLAPIVGRVQGCGVANPVRVTAVGGLRLSQPATMDCDTARALNTWIDRGLKPAIGKTGGGVQSLQVAGHYVCRTRNHKTGARVSEHGKGKAIDISAIGLANGQSLSILRDWRGVHGAKLKAAHRAACGIFGTTLGPGSDGYHEDHLHFDTARHRSGSYCR